MRFTIYEVRFTIYDLRSTRNSPLEIEDSTIPKKSIKSRVRGARGVFFYASLFWFKSGRITDHVLRYTTRDEAERSEANYESKKNPRRIVLQGFVCDSCTKYYLSNTSKAEFILLYSGTIFFIWATMASLL